MPKKLRNSKHTAEPIEVVFSITEVEQEDAFNPISEDPIQTSQCQTKKRGRKPRNSKDVIKRKKAKKSIEEDVLSKTKSLRRSTRPRKETQKLIDSVNLSDEDLSEDIAPKLERYGELA